MISNKKVFKYKVIDHIEIYNFGTNHVNVRVHSTN